MFKTAFPHVTRDVLMRIRLIYNPAAGRRNQRRELPDVVDLFTSAGWQVDVAETRGPGHASRLAQQASADGYDVVLIAGGDGSVNQVVDGLMRAREAGQAGTILGILPAGTANVLAHDLGLPAPSLGRGQTLVAAARELLRASVTRLDVGRATTGLGSRYFLCWAGVGLDAAVTRTVEEHQMAKQLLGPAYFAAALLREVNRPDLVTEYVIELDEEQWREQGCLVVASNIRRYAAIIDIAPQARLDDGLLDVTFVRAAGLLELAKLAPPFLSGDHIRLSEVRYSQSRRIRVRTAVPQPVHVDAEPFATTPLEVEVVPRALSILIPPATVSRALFTAGNSP